MGDDRFIVEHLEDPSKDELYPKLRKRGFIKKKFTYKKNSKTLGVIIPYWHGKFSSDIVLRDKMLLHGISVLEYEFAPYILSADATVTKEYFLMIKEQIVKDIQVLVKKHTFTDCHVLGASLGSCHATMISNQVDLVSKVILITPAHSLAVALWDGVRTQHFRQEYKKQGLTKTKLDEFWSDLAPENNISNLKGKEVHLVLSKNDEVIAYKYGKKLEKSLRKLPAKVNIKVHEHVGHYLTVLEELIFSNDY